MKCFKSVDKPHVGLKCLLSKSTLKHSSHTSKPVFSQLMEPCCDLTSLQSSSWTCELDVEGCRRVPVLFFPLVLLLPYNFLEKTSCLFTGRRAIQRGWETKPYVMSSSFSVPLVPSSSPPPLPPSALLYFPLFSPSMLCVLSHCWTITPVCVFVYVYVCVCGAIFGPSKATKHSLPSCSFSVSLLCSYMACE